MFLYEYMEDPTAVVAAFKRASNGETLTKQKRVQNDIEEYTKLNETPTTRIRGNPDLPTPSKKA